MPLAGFVGLLVAAEAAAFMSTLSSLINWGGSFVVNDLIPEGWKRQPARQVWLSRLTTLVLFVLAAGVTILYVNNMVSWFMFINSAMVIFLLPLAWFRFFWWRFYERCRPPGFWGPVQTAEGSRVDRGPTLGKLLFDSTLGILACLGLVLATNAVFAGNWVMTIGGAAGALGFGAWLIGRVLDHEANEMQPVSEGCTVED